MPRATPPESEALSRRRFLTSLAAPAVAAAAVGPVAAVAEAATRSSARKRAGKPPAAPGPGAPAAQAPTTPAARGPDLTVARTPEERATLEKQWKSQVDTLEALRRIALSEATGPAFTFASLAPRGKGHS